jgi:hypothetical protein
MSEVCMLEACECAVHVVYRHVTRAGARVQRQ